jgi:hypothetical protein
MREQGLWRGEKHTYSQVGQRRTREKGPEPAHSEQGWLGVRQHGVEVMHVRGGGGGAQAGGGGGTPNTLAGVETACA